MYFIHSSNLYYLLFVSITIFWNSNNWEKLKNKLLKNKIFTPVFDKIDFVFLFEFTNKFP